VFTFLPPGPNPKRKYTKKKPLNTNRLTSVTPVPTELLSPSTAPPLGLPQHLEPTPQPKPKTNSKYIEPAVPLLDRADRVTRNKFGKRDTRTVRILTTNELTRLRHLAPESCRLAIGPSQQYDGGQELYLDQSQCPAGTTIAYYDGKEISEDEADRSTSKYIFKLDASNGTFIYIDAEDPMCCYARYADDSHYDGTENAHWVPL